MNSMLIWSNRSIWLVLVHGFVFGVPEPNNFKLNFGHFHSRNYLNFLKALRAACASVLHASLALGGTSPLGFWLILCQKLDYKNLLVLTTIATIERAHPYSVLLGP